MVDIYKALENDHQELKNLLSELVDLEENDSYREVVIENINTLLTSHSRAEESVLYNSMRAMADSDVVMHSYKEHMEAEAKLRKLQLKEVSGADWTTVATELRDALLHHIDEEEHDVFNEARKIFSKQEAEQMGEAFLTLQSQIRDQGFLKNSFDLVVNLMPPRFIDKVKNLGSSMGNQ